MFVAGQFAAIAFPSWKLQKQLQVCHFARRDHVEAKGKVGENPEKWQNKSIFVLENMIELGHVMQSHGLWYEVLRLMDLARWVTRDVASFGSKYFLRAFKMFSYICGIEEKKWGSIGYTYGIFITNYFCYLILLTW